MPPDALDEEHPKILVSYAQGHPDWQPEEVEEWKTTLLRFATLLCELGLDAELDQFHAHDPEVDWNRFGPQLVHDSDYVLIAVSQGYRERWEGRNDPAVGAGAVREADALQGLFNEDQQLFRRKVKIVVLPGASLDDVPRDLSGLQRYFVTEFSEGALEDLYRTVTKQPATPKPPIGPLRRLQPRTLTEAQERAVEATARSGGKLDELRLALARVEAGLSEVPDDVKTEAHRGQLALPWVRVARQLMLEQQSILERINALADSPVKPGEMLAENPFVRDLGYYEREFGRVFALASDLPYRAVLDGVALVESALRDRASREFGIDPRGVPYSRLLPDVVDMRVLDDREAAHVEDLFEIRGSLIEEGKMVSVEEARSLVSRSQAVVHKLLHPDRPFDQSN